MAEIERRMTERRARDLRLRIARRAYDEWRGRWPWRWMPERFHARLFEAFGGLDPEQMPSEVVALERAEQMRERVGRNREAVVEPGDDPVVWITETMRVAGMEADDGER